MQLLGITQFLAQCIIRPPKASYNIEQLGKKTFCYQNRIYERIDMEIPQQKRFKRKKEEEDSQYEQNMQHRKFKAIELQQIKQQDCIFLQTSLYQDKYSLTPRDTIIFLHANSASRVSIKNYLQVLIKKYDVVAFDFRGCGNTSNSQYITLGYLEKYDVQRVIQYINKHHGQRKYILWGRSMGAVTALLHCQKFRNAAALVVDSPFSDLRKVIDWLIAQKMPITPSFVVENILESIESYVQQKIKEQYNYKFKISKLKPLEAVRQIKIPIFFIGSEKDQIVDIEQVRKLYICANGFKKLVVMPGGHNQIRTNPLKREIVNFLKESLELNIDPMVKRKKIFSYRKEEQRKIDATQEKEKQQPVIFQFEGNEQICSSLILCQDNKQIKKNRIFSRNSK